jgi:hypothetical protein
MGGIHISKIKDLRNFFREINIALHHPDPQKLHFSVN